MKRAGRQAEAFCRAPDPASAAVLLFGKPGSPLDEHAELLVGHWLSGAREPLERKRVTAEDAKQDPGEIIDDLYSASLFGGASLIQVTISRENEAGPFLDALSAIEARGELPAGRLLVIAGDLTNRSKMRKGFEAAKHATALQFFERSAREFEIWVRDRLKADNVRLEADARELLIQTLLDDQSLAASELDKLALFAVDHDKPLTVRDVGELIALEDQSSHFELIDLALDGKASDLARVLPRIALEAAAIPLLIGLMNQLKRISQAHDISASGIQGPGIGERLTPRIFDRQWPDFDRRMKTWGPPRILALMNRVAEVDASCRRASSPQEAIVGRLLMDIASAAQARGR